MKERHFQGSVAMVETISQTDRSLMSSTDFVNDQMEVVYDQLYHIAASYLRCETNELMLEPASLVHEAYLRLASSKTLSCKNPAHFFAIAAVAMRRILIDHARRRRALKRDLSGSRISLELITKAGSRDVDILEVDDAIKKLAALHPRWSRIVELRFFAGLDHDDVADVLNVSRKTVVKDWGHARSWLAEELAG